MTWFSSVVRVHVFLVVKGIKHSERGNYSCEITISNSCSVCLFVLLRENCNQGCADPLIHVKESL